MRQLLIRYLTFTMLLAHAASLGAWAVDPGEASFQQGVKAYREGQYQQAQTLFESLHSAKPEDSRSTYYLAMTMAQLGRFQQAKKLYEEILLLAPQSNAAVLAKEGLKYLPKADDALDVPPKFDAQNPATPSLNNYSPQDLQALQQMMTQMGGGNAAAPFLYGGQSNGHGTVNGLDPSIMNTLMMNQMLQNFNMGGENNNQ